MGVLVFPGAHLRGGAWRPCVVLRHDSHPLDDALVNPGLDVGHGVVVAAALARHVLGQVPTGVAPHGRHVKDDGNIRTDWFMYVRDPDGILVEFVELPDK